MTRHTSTTACKPAPGTPVILIQEAAMKPALPVLCALMLALPAYAGEERQEKVATAAVTQDQSQVVELLGDSYLFKPDRIAVKANVPVELKVRKAPGMVPHNFVIDAPRAGVRVKEDLGKEPKTIRVTFSTPGEYPFFCSKKPPFGKAHRERGMEGTIVVTK